MLVKRFEAALPYEAPNHFDMRALRLQGFEEGGPKKFWVGLSHILPGGRAGPDSSPIEKVYVIQAGCLTLRIGGRTEILGPNDSCCIGPNEEREIVNETNDVTTMIVIMPYPEAKAETKG